jgi:hypothetical protein
MNDLASFFLSNLKASRAAALKAATLTDPWNDAL